MKKLPVIPAAYDVILQLEGGLLEGEGAGIGADIAVVDHVLQLPQIGVGVEPLELLDGAGEGDFLALAALEMHTFETAQQLHGAVDGGIFEADVHLGDFLAFHVADVLHGAAGNDVVAFHGEGGRNAGVFQHFAEHGPGFILQDPRCVIRIELRMS